ncbi:hypothetical protein B0H16DRAFT_1604374 [Mycena metata]|uniref:Uncharacterized protein n=1 Tax=Mycena metata TaxID=1033252 RepID=A0AAD7HHD7_9AGAR|nr:hypothetical protein B0H16DRAFT_1604374 [Mycena metata]
MSRRSPNMLLERVDMQRTFGASFWCWCCKLHAHLFRADLSRISGTPPNVYRVALRPSYDVLHPSALFVFAGKIIMAWCCPSESASLRCYSLVATLLSASDSFHGTPFQAFWESFLPLYSFDEIQSFAPTVSLGHTPTSAPRYNLGLTLRSLCDLRAILRFPLRSPPAFQFSFSFPEKLRNPTLGESIPPWRQSPSNQFVRHMTQILHRLLYLLAPSPILA